MKNNSVKFKQNVPKSSTTSIISEFSCDESPMPNSFQFQSFTHAQTISAKLNKNSIYNEQNIMFNTPRNLAVPYQEIEKDEVLSKTPVNKQLLSGTKQNNSVYMEPASFSEALIIQSKYTEESLKKIQKLEKFLEKTKQKYQKPINILSSDESPSKSISHIRIQGLTTTTQEGLENQLDPKINKKVNRLIDELRIIRKNIQYFSAFDGTYAQSRKMQNNFISLKQQNGIIINNGTHLTRLELINDTFSSEKICNIIDKNQKFISFCICDKNISNDMLITGTDQGSIMGWNLFKNQAYHYYGLNNQYNCNMQEHSQPTFITQQLNNIYVGYNNELLILDERMNERKCFQLQIQKQQLNGIQANQILSPLLPKFGSTIIESPQFNPIDPNLFNLTSFKLDEEQDSIKDDFIEQLPSFKQIQNSKSQYIQHIDVHDYNVVVTMTNGFIHLDMRNPTIAQFSFQENEQQALKAMFTPGNSNNIIYAKQNSNRCLLWNISKNQVLFDKELQSNPLDMTIAHETKEILFLHQDYNDSIIKIYNNSCSKLKYCDELIIPNFNVQKILLNYQCDNLYGIGPYSLRTWNYYQKKEIDLIREEMLHQLELLI
ncbi:unnamed protein product [Paramecium primaurelia]|uniref:Uncharacterized protein n=1 Tax=Paramecium primaurelia TaxID=5886 RepID=A0A8S1LYL6_PARPR|nr:unnamed protein product [Paramecium primaurelia]